VAIPPRFKHLGVPSLDPAMSKLGAMDADAVALWLQYMACVDESVVEAMREEGVNGA